MAKKKATSPKPRRRKTLGAKMKRKKPRRRKSAKGFLGEMISPAALKEGGRSAVSGFLGGGIGGAIDSMLPADTNDFLRLALHGTGVVLLGGGFKLPKMAAGYAGGIGWEFAKRVEQKLMSEMDSANYANQESLEDCPDALDENGNAMYLAEDGNFYYLEDFELSEDGEMYLAASMQDYNMYPQYVNSSSY